VPHNLTEQLEMHRVAAKFVARFLTDEQRANRVKISQELFVRSSADENFLKNVVLGDETCVGYDIETKAQSSQWVGKPPQKNTSKLIKCENVFDRFLWEGRRSS
jgi:hypothetical protein